MSAEDKLLRQVANLTATKFYYSVLVQHTL